MRHASSACQCSNLWHSAVERSSALFTSLVPNSLKCLIRYSVCSIRFVLTTFESRLTSVSVYSQYERLTFKFLHEYVLPWKSANCSWVRLLKLEYFYASATSSIDGWRNHVFYLSVHLSITKLVHVIFWSARDILKMTEQILMHIGTRGPWGNGVKRSASGLTESNQI